MSVAPSEAFNAIGTPHTVTFVCGGAVSTLRGPAGTANPGCFGVTMSATDMTNGALIPITDATCAGMPVAPAGPFACAAQANPICPAGLATSGGLCQPTCPTIGTFVFTYSPADQLCHAQPQNNTCPPGTTAVTNSGGTPTDCTTPPLTAATAQNQATATIKPGAPHVYRIDFTGFVNTNAAGQCPAGTTLEATIPAAAGIPAPACEFVVSAYKKYLEVTRIDITPTVTCPPFTPTTLQAIQAGGPACLFRVTATGIVIIKQNANCSQEPTGPVIGTPTPGTAGVEPLERAVDEVAESSAAEVAEGLAEGPDLTEAAAGTFICEAGTLMLERGVPGVSITLTAVNGVFPGVHACIPQEVATAEAMTPTPTPTITATPVETPTPTPTPTAPATATPIPTVSGSVEPGFCSPLGSTQTTVVTGQNGFAPFLPAEIETAAIPSASAACQYQPTFTSTTIPGPTVYICGRIFAEDVGLAGAGMSAVFGFPSFPPPSGTVCNPVGPQTTTGEAITDAEGRAICSQQGIFGTGFTGSDLVTVDVIFDLTGQLEGNKCRTQTSFVRTFGTATPVPTVEPLVTPCNLSTAGIAVSPTGFGPLSVTAMVNSIINTQPSVSNTLNLTQVSLPEPAAGATSAATSIAAPTATNTPVPTPTNTSVPTAAPPPTEVPTVPPPPTSTPTPTATPVRTLRFSLDAARVSKVGNPGNRSGLNTVRPGDRVELMMYFTISSLPKKLTRVTTYEVDRNTRLAFRVAFKGPVKPPTDIGHWVRFANFTVPRDASYGVYVYRATLTIGGRSQTQFWKFAVLKAGPVIAPAGYDVNESAKPPSS